MCSKGREHLRRAVTGVNGKMDCLVVKPSGSPSGTVTDEDITAAEEGHEFAFELSQEPIRYIRLKILSTWGGSAFTHPAEVDLYGEVVE